MQHQNNGAWANALNSWMNIRSSCTKKEEYIFQNRVLLNQVRHKGNQNLSKKNALFLAKYLIWFKRWGEGKEILNKIKQDDLSNQEALQYLRLSLSLGEYQSALTTLNGIVSNSFQEQLERDIIGIWIDFLTGKQEIALRNIARVKKSYLYIKDSLLIPHHSLNSQQMMQYPWLRSLVMYPHSEEFLENMFWHYWSKKDLVNLRPLINSQKKLFKHGENVEGLFELLKGDLRLPEQINTVKGSGFLTPKYLEGRLENAREDNDWVTYKTLVDQYIKSYPELEDGKYYLAEYQRYSK